MTEFWEHLSALEKIFSSIALFSNLLLFFQVIGAMFLGDLDIEDVPEDFTVDASLPVLSMKALTAFFTFFGWTGYMLLRDGHLVLTAVAWAVFAGSVALFFTAWLLKSLSKLEHAPEMNLNTVLHKEAEVYLTIPEYMTGIGKVHVEVQGTLREIDAQTEGGRIATGGRVRIVGVLDSVLLVERSIV